MALTKSRCPECAKQGKDTSRDNLITYSDGHSHCFSCGYHTQAGTRERIMEKTQSSSRIFVQLPEDISFEIPELPLAWIRKYLTDSQIKIHNIGYSQERKLLIFPYFDKGKDLLAWQGRYFGDDQKHAKWWSQGVLHEILYILEGKINVLGPRSIVLVEDIVSAIKVSEVQTALPIFGSVVNTLLLTRLRILGYNSINIWLDPDKRKEAIAFTLKARQFGLDARPIFSEFDPKDYTTDKIRFLLD